MEVAGGSSGSGSGSGPLIPFFSSYILNRKSYTSWLLETCQKWDLKAGYNSEKDFFRFIEARTLGFAAECGVLHGGKIISVTGNGTTKKGAQHTSAYNMLIKFGLSTTTLATASGRSKPTELLNRLVTVEAVSIISSGNGTKQPYAGPSQVREAPISPYHAQSPAFLYQVPHPTPIRPYSHQTPATPVPIYSFPQSFPDSISQTFLTSAETAPTYQTPASSYTSQLAPAPQTYSYQTANPISPYLAPVPYYPSQTATPTYPTFPCQASISQGQPTAHPYPPYQTQTYSSPYQATAPYQPPTTTPTYPSQQTAAYANYPYQPSPISQNHASGSNANYPYQPPAPSPVYDSQIKDSIYNSQTPSIPPYQYAAYPSYPPAPAPVPQTPPPISPYHTSNPNPPRTIDLVYNSQIPPPISPYSAYPAQAPVPQAHAFNYQPPVCPPHYHQTAAPTSAYQIPAVASSSQITRAPAPASAYEPPAAIFPFPYHTKSVIASFQQSSISPFQPPVPQPLQNPSPSPTKIPRTSFDESPPKNLWSTSPKKTHIEDAKAAAELNKVKEVLATQNIKPKKIQQSEAGEGRPNFKTGQSYTKEQTDKLIRTLAGDTMDGLVSDKILHNTSTETLQALAEDALMKCADVLLEYVELGAAVEGWCMVLGRMVIDGHAIVTPGQGLSVEEANEEAANKMVRMLRKICCSNRWI